jgi:hypothetical protein
MMFKTITITLLSLFFNFLFLINEVKTNSFDLFKQSMIKDLMRSKLENYMKKIKMKKSDLIDDNFFFIEKDSDFLILKNLSQDDINFKKSISVQDIDEFKARVFSYIYKNKGKGESDDNNVENISSNKNIFHPLGVNLDDEKFPKWKIFLVLISSQESINHKLIKICFPTEDFKENFAIILNFDKKCSPYIENIVNSESFNSENENLETTKQLHFMQSKIANNKIREKINKNKLNQQQLLNNQQQMENNSFLEKSSENAVYNNKHAQIQVQQQTPPETGKTFSIESLANKFSVEELTKIKSLIKFAKNNKLLDEIYKKEGNLKMEDLVQGYIKQNNIVDQSSQHSSINDFKNISQSFLNNSTLLTTMKQEVSNLTNNLLLQENRIGNYFNSMNSSILNMKDMVKYVKDITNEFHKSLLTFGNTLSQVDSKVGKIDNKMQTHTKELTEFKFRQVEKEEKEDKRMEQLSKKIEQSHSHNISIHDINGGNKTADLNKESMKQLLESFMKTEMKKMLQESLSNSTYEKELLEVKETLKKEMESIKEEITKANLKKQDIGREHIEKSPTQTTNLSFSSQKTQTQKKENKKPASPFLASNFDSMDDDDMLDVGKSKKSNSRVNTLKKPTKTKASIATESDDDDFA